MGYYINPSQLISMFAVPAAVADEHLRLATEIQLKVIIYVWRHHTETIDVQSIAAALAINSEEVEDALIFWAQRGILNSDSPIAEPKSAPRQIVVKTEKPSRTDAAKRGLADTRIRMLLHEAQLKFERPLKDNETRTLVWIFEDLGMEIPVILMLLQYAVSKDKRNIRFIEKTAQDWLKDGIETVSDAEQRIEKETREELAWSMVRKAFGIDRKKPSTKELTYANLWVNEWQLSNDILIAAYDECVNNTAELSIPYIAKILENWHKSGIKTAADAIKKSEGKKPEIKNSNRKHSYAGYDISDIEKLMNS